MADLRSSFRTQADACGRLGSVMYEQLLHRITDGLGSTGPVDRVLEGHQGDPGPSALALRLLGTVHRLVLEGNARDLAPYYPSVGGSWHLDLAWPVLLDLLDSQVEVVRAGLLRPPQTNEVGRCAALVGALLRLPAAVAYPIRLYELGASAGLNLRADCYHYRGVGGWWGPADSPVRLDGAWEGLPTPADRRLLVVERVGCDPAPVDPTTPDGRLRLTSYVWPDQADRLERLRGAMGVAARVPADVRTQGAAEMLSGLQLRAGTCTVLWHSLMWQYVDPGDQTTVREHLARLAAAAHPVSPFVHVHLEPRRRRSGADQEFLVGAEQWPADPVAPSTVAGTAVPHGLPVTWEC